jgi:hypothetical protein
MKTIQSFCQMIIFFIFILYGKPIYAQRIWNHGNLKVTKNGHDLCFEDGYPFFWLGDTGWELFHRLTLPEINLYLENRASKGFNVIQAVVLPEVDGMKKNNRYGDLPLKNENPAMPNESYFKLIDSVVRSAERLGMFMGLLPTWGDKVTAHWGTGPVIFDTATAYAYGKWIADRYKSYKNIIWILGGDRPAIRDSNNWVPVWRAMANGIIAGAGHKFLITYHPWGGSYSTSQFLAGEKWLDLNMIQSGHGNGHDVACWDLIKRDYNIEPTKPVLDAEPNYEDHPVNPWPKWNTDSGYFRAYDVRKQIYRSVFAGACGVTYGHHAVWQFMDAYQEAINYPDRGWINAMDRPGAFQAGYLRRLIESRPFLNRVIDSTLVVDPNGIKGEHMEMFRAADNSYAMIYLPVGRTITLKPGFLKNVKMNVWWFNPRDNSYTAAALPTNRSNMVFTSPSLGKSNDWVLVIDDAKYNFTHPGKDN